VSFQWPYVLLALLAVPLLAALYVLRERRRLESAGSWGNPALLPNLVAAEPGRRRHVPIAILLLAIAVLVVGAARPRHKVDVRRQEATVVLVVDVSRSMRATDVRPSRLVAGLHAAMRLAQQVPKSYRIALVSFGSRAAVAMPPTANRAQLALAFRNLRPGQGTALGDAIALAVRIGQRERSVDHTVPPESVLVISDGAAQGGTTSANAAAAIARRAHVPVSAIVLGTPAGIVRATMRGGYHVTIQVPPSAATLKRITSTTGGELYTAASDRRLRDVYERLASHLGSEHAQRELGDRFGAAALALMLVGGGLSAAWFRRVP
jgi:Ca-activated chloride channel homolog